MFKKIKLKKTKWFIGLSLGIIFIIGLIAFQQTYYNKISNYQKNIEDRLLSSDSEVDYLFQMIDREEKNINKEINYAIILANLKLDSKRLEEEAQFLSYLSPLIKRIEVDPNKTELTYAYEVANILNKVNLINFDFSDKQSLNNNGIFLLSLTDELSKIKPTPNYLNVHKAEIVILGGIGYALKELSTTNDNERAMALIKIINDLIDYQKKLADYLK
jgi:hypothetical protein